jgi:uroporphyrinogen III methyltransferase/synthase
LTPARPLAGLTVLVPRARDQASSFSALLRSRGAEPLEVPTIEIRPVASTAALDQAVEDLAAGRYDWVVLTSVNGVAALRTRVEALGPPPPAPGPPPPPPGQVPPAPDQDQAALGLDPAVLGKARVAAVGPATEAALRDWGVVPDLVPEVATTAALGQAFPPGPGAVLLARADLANPELAVILRDKAWRTTEVAAYHTVPVGTLDPAARRRLDAGEVDWVAFTASSTVDGFLQGYGGPPPPGVRVAAIGPVTADTARAAGIRVAATAAEHTIPGLVTAIEHAVAP